MSIKRIYTASMALVSMLFLKTHFSPTSYIWKIQDCIIAPPKGGTCPGGTEISVVSQVTGPSVTADEIWMVNMDGSSADDGFGVLEVFTF